MSNLYFSDFLAQHRLPLPYTLVAQQWFFPLARSLVRKHRQSGHTLIVGISGCQGSGKSTLADLLALTLRELHQKNTVVLSIDDFYLGHQQRQILSRTVHPLLATRGAPGTHDVALAIRTLDDLCARGAAVIPRFDKALDDRTPQEEWDRVTEKPDIIIFEGWCLGAEPQSDDALQEPVNTLEKTEDPDGTWRRYVNQQLIDTYPGLFSMINTWVMLQAPSFDVVYPWRLEQEAKLKKALPASTASTERTMSEPELKHFIQYYQRITEQLLKTLPEKVDYLFKLDTSRNITEKILKIG